MIPVSALQVFWSLTAGRGGCCGQDGHQEGREGCHHIVQISLENFRSGLGQDGHQEGGEGCHHIVQISLEIKVLWGDGKDGHQVKATTTS